LPWISSILDLTPLYWMTIDCHPNSLIPQQHKHFP
jgi:hypothetical protein